MMARWLIGLQSDGISARKTFNMMRTVISSRGDLLEEGKPTAAERAWLRLAAGCAMLKICEQKGVSHTLWHSNRNHATSSKRGRSERFTI